MHIEMMPLTTLLAMEFRLNPKEHAVDDLRESFIRFGFIAPPTIDEGTQVMVAGHGRCKTLAIMREGFDPPPKRIELGDGGEWLVPVLRGIKFDNEEERDAYVIADNRLVMAGGLKLDTLSELLADIRARAAAKADGAGSDPERAADRATSALGFERSELDGLLARLRDRQGQNDDGSRDAPPPTDDDIPLGGGADGDVEVDVPDELPKRTITKPGNVWKLGDHRLVCGDMLVPEIVAAALSGQTPALLVTDPPDEDSIEDQRRKKKATTLQPGIIAFAAVMARACPPGTPGYIMSTPADIELVRAAAKEAGFHWSSTIIWAQQSMVPGRKDYGSQYAPIWYGWRSGAPRKCAPSDRGISDLWQFDRPRKSLLFPTMKPVALVARAIASSSKHGDVVFDPFGGTGPVLLACAQQGRRCSMIDLDPASCDVVVERWQSLTGKKAIRSA